MVIKLGNQLIFENISWLISSNRFYLGSESEIAQESEHSYLLCLLYVDLSTVPSLLCPLNFDLSTVSSLLWHLYSVLYNVSSLLFTLCCVLSTVTSLLCPLYCMCPLLCPLYGVLYTVTSLLCPLYGVLSTVISLLCPLYCDISTVTSLMWPIYCVLSTASSLLCPLYCVPSTLSYLQCPSQFALSTVFSLLCTLVSKKVPASLLNSAQGEEMVLSSVCSATRLLKLRHLKGPTCSKCPNVILYRAHCTPHVHFTLHTEHCTLHTEHCTLHTEHCTLHTEHTWTNLPLSALISSPEAEVSLVTPLGTSLPSMFLLGTTCRRRTLRSASLSASRALRVSTGTWGRGVSGHSGRGRWTYYWIHGGWIQCKTI